MLMFEITRDLTRVDVDTQKIDLMHNDEKWITVLNWFKMQNTQRNVIFHVYVLDWDYVIPGTQEVYVLFFEL